MEGENLKITLILAAAEDDPLRTNDPFMPLSLPLVAGAAPDHDYTFVDMLAGEEPDLDAPADLVGISARMTAERTAYDLADQYRRKGVPVVLGGPQISSVPHRAAGHADAVAVGEAELLWPVILEDLGRGDLKTFYVASPEPFDAQGETHHQIDHYLDLAETPAPQRQHYTKTYDFDTVFAARGCHVDCDFCSVPFLHGRKTRLRPVADVVADIDSLGSMFYLLDDTVFGRPAHHAYYAELYDTLAKLKKRRLWTGQANLDAAATEEGREVIRKAARSGLVYASIGMESLNPDVLAKAGTVAKHGVRGAEDPIARMREHIRFIQDQGIIITGWFTVGYEEDTPQTFYDALAFCEEMDVIPILCPLEAIPGTRLEARLEAEGRVDRHKTINVVHPTMTDDDLIAAMSDATEKGFSGANARRRVWFHMRRFMRADPGVHNKVENVIKRTMFALKLEKELKAGIIGFANMERKGEAPNGP